MSLLIKTPQLFRISKTIASSKLVPVRNNKYISSPFVEDIETTTKYQVSKCAEEWKYVERILPSLTVPELRPREIYNSGFKPQGDNLTAEPYYIARTKNHMLPVYLEIYQRGVRRLTHVRKIQGNIWLLGEELEKFLQPMSKRPLRMQINEFAGLIVINGDYVNAIKHWLIQKNF